MSVSTTQDGPPASRSPHSADSTPESRLLRVVGVWGLAASIVNLTIGGGIFVLPSKVYATLGTASPLAYVVCAVLMGLIVMCFAEAGSRVSLTGGLYAYSEVAFGPLIGFVAGALLWAGMTAAMAAVAFFFGDAMAAMIPALARPVPRAVVIAAVLTGLATVNVFGVGNASRFNTLLTAAKLAPLAVIMAVGLISLRADNLAIGGAPAASDLARGSVILMFAFLGVESALIPSGEVREPERTVPRAIALALGAVVVVYSSVQLVAQSTLGSALATSSTPIADAGGVLIGPSGRTMILVGSAVSMFGYVSGMTLSVPRMLFAFGRDGFLPSKLAAVHPRFRTPHVAIIVQAIISIVLATTGTFEQLIIVANGSMLTVYGICALAVYRLRQLGVTAAGRPYVVPFGSVVPALALAAIFWLLFSLKREEWLALAIVVAVALVVFVATRRTRAARSSA